jgi:hypothetical protein
LPAGLPLVNYTRDVKLFLAWLSENTAINSIVEVTPAQLQQYKIALYNFLRHDDYEPATKEKAAAEPKRLSMGTQANRLAAVRKFFSWLLGSALRVITYTRRYSQSGWCRTGVAPIITDGATYAGVVIVGHAVMRLIAGPASEDRLAR